MVSCVAAAAADEFARTVMVRNGWKGNVMKSRMLIAAGLAALALAVPQAYARKAEAGGWQRLSGSTGLSAWRGYKSASTPTAWRVEDGAITLGTEGSRGDIVSVEEYGDFELQLEWKIGPGGNSGIFYFVQETPGAPHTFSTGLEMQVLDDKGHPDGTLPSHRAGALYDLIACREAAARPVGSWNRVRIVARDGRIEHWLNGKRVIATRFGDERWRALVANSKFASMPDFARVPRGRIALQDHGDRVWYRNIRIRRL
jgi:hypothetical protein